MTSEGKTYDKKFNAQRGAQRTGLKSGEFDVFKTPDGRFGWRAVAEPAPHASIGVSDPALAEHPMPEANAASWPSGPKVGKRKAIIEQAQAGALPAAPDFSKPTHARFRGEARQADGARRSGRCRRPEGDRDQSGFYKPEGHGALSRSGDHRAGAGGRRSGRHRRSHLRIDLVVPLTQKTRTVRGRISSSHR